MKKRYIVLLLLTIIIVLSIFIVLYGKLLLKHIDYDEFVNSSLYYYVSEEEVYSSYLDLKDFFIDDNSINNADDLLKMADYVLIIKVDEEPLFRGNSIINNCTVKKVIKGEGINKNDNILVYDLIGSWFMSGTGYFGGSTPLVLNNEYIVFINKAPRPSIKDSFVFSSFKYGHITLNKTSKYKLDYEQYSSSIFDISEYDYVFPAGYSIDDVVKYEKIRDEILLIINK